MLPRLLILAAAAIAYSNSFEAALVFDSSALTFEDERVEYGDTHALLTSNYWGKRFNSGLYRPVTSMTYLLDYATHGETRTGYHVVNFGLHCAAALLAFEVVTMLAGGTVAFWAALLWAVHPLGTEAVTNIAGRPDLLAACAVLAGMLVYGSGYRRWRLTSLFLIALIGCFSKESAVVLLPLCLLLDLHERCRPDVRGLACIAVPCAAIMAIHFSLPMVRPFVDNPLVAMGWWDSRMMALRLAARMAGLWLWPDVLSADYSYSAVKVTGDVPLMGVALVLVACVSWLAMSQPFGLDCRKIQHLPGSGRPWEAVQPFGLCGKGCSDHATIIARASFFIPFAAIALLPTSNLILQSGSIMAERFMYLPGLGLAVLLVMAVRAVDLWDTGGALAVICILLAFRTYARNEDYRDSLTFWRATVAASPGSFKAQSQLAAELYDRGDLQGAVAHSSVATAVLAPVPDRDNVMPSWSQAFSYLDAVGRKGEAKVAADRVASILNAQGRKK